MQDENQNSWQRVSDRLDGMDSLPGDASPGYEKIWSGISARLYPAKRRAALWWAAAALLLCFSTAMVLRYPTGGSGHKSSDQKKGWTAKKMKQAPASPATATKTLASDSTVTRTLTAGEANSASASPVATVTFPVSPEPALPATHKREFRIPKKIAVRQIRADKNFAAVITSAFLTDSVRVPHSEIVPDDAPEAAGLPVPVATSRKPLRVVHLNDLEEPVFSEYGRESAIKGNLLSPASWYPAGYLSGRSSTSVNAGLAAPRNSFFRINLNR